MADLDLQAPRARMRTEIEALDRELPADAAGAGGIVAGGAGAGDVVAEGDAVVNAAPLPPLPLLGLVDPPLPQGPPPGQQGGTPLRQPGRAPVATTSAAAAARLIRVATPRPAAPEADGFDQRGVIPPHMARLMQQQQARGNPTQGNCLSGFGGIQSQQPTQQQQQQQGGDQAFTFPAQGGGQPAQPGANATRQFLPLGGMNYQPVHLQQYPPYGQFQEGYQGQEYRGAGFQHLYALQSGMWPQAEGPRQPVRYSAMPIPVQPPDVDQASWYAANCWPSLPRDRFQVFLHFHKLGKY
jgi:hypothetical protein